ncbi:hypothetical protein IFM89_019031 [Coptis chinensis]|uniref:DCD domain-containing protein n=1 Tax=Coptis chinensis TaxID=261450 RepID=A0A835LN38_9MAGN|nr:hypothetical protein IFM89_019031 [Coptis chinensis]
MGRGRKKESQMKKKKNERHTLADNRIPHARGVNSSAPAFHYTKEQLGGVIFACKTETMEECLTNLLFGLPKQHYSYVKNIVPGLPIFLFNCNGRNLYGIFEAASHGWLDINPHAWTDDGSQKTKFPAQVRVRIPKQIKFLPEMKYKKVIQKNYIDEFFFRFELDRRQTSQLISLFESSPATFRRPLQVSSPRTEGVKLITEEASAEYVTATSGLIAGVDLPIPGTRTWASLFKETCESDARSEADDKKSSVSEASWEEESSSTPSCWDEDEGTSGLTPCNDKRMTSTTQLDREATEDEEELTRLKQLPFEREMSNSEESIDVFSVCGTDHPHVEDKHSPTTPLQSEENLNSEEETEDGYFPCGTGDNLASKKYEDMSSNLFGPPSGIDQLKQELEGVKAFSLNQHNRTCALEKDLADSRILLQQLRDHVMLLESQLQNPSTAGIKVWKDACISELPIDKSDSGMLFIMGGYDGVSWLPTVNSYSPYEDIVRSVKPMSSLRSNASAAVLNGLIYNFGGWNSYSNLWYDTVECYDPLSNMWFSCPKLHEKKGCLASASLGNRIYAIGGGNGKECFKEVEMFDPTSEKWIPSHSMLQQRFSSAAAELDGALYVVGGYDGNTYLKSAERFDPREASWSRLQSMNTCRASHTLTVFHGKLFALGGYNGHSYVPSIEVFDPRMGSWLEGDEMKQPRGYFVAPVIGETIYAIGGKNEGNNMVEAYRIGQGWSEAKLKGIGKRCFFSAVLH